MEKGQKNYEAVVELNKKVRQAGIDWIPKDKRDTVVEVFSGKRVLTNLYKENGFVRCVTNDLDVNNDADYHMKSLDFLELIPKTYPIIDILDLDAWGSPTDEIKLFFTQIEFHLPIVISFSDGLGQWMKRTKRPDLLVRRYLLDKEPDMYRIWDHHPQLIHNMIEKLCKSYEIHCKPLMVEQTKNKNYTLASYAFSSTPI